MAGIYLPYFSLSKKVLIWLESMGRLDQFAFYIAFKMALSGNKQLNARKSKKFAARSQPPRRKTANVVNLNRSLGWARAQKAL